VNTFDRYIIRSFLRNYVLSSVVLIGLYVLLDVVLKFDELSRSSTSREGQAGLLALLSLLWNIGDYYFFQSFYFFVQLAGVIPVAAAAFTLFRMTRSNELTAMLAAGVPLLRIAAPIIIAGSLLNGLLVVDQELLVPRMINKLSRDPDDASREAGSSFAIPFMQDQAGSLLMAARYIPPQKPGDAPRIERLDVIERNEAFDPVAHVEAKSAVYDALADVWRLDEGHRTTGLRPDEKLDQVDIGVWKTTITPAEIMIYRRHRTAELLSSSQIADLLQRPRSYGTLPLLRVKHWRIVQPLGNIVLLLLAIPCVLLREPGSLRWAATRAVVLTGACMACMFVAHQMAGTPRGGMDPTTWVLLLLWMPIFIFAPIAVVLLDRVKT
jgi:lipopolysaccharide export LptBFGC system permease protein LptF